jgi:arsenate reductase
VNPSAVRVLAAHGVSIQEQRPKRTEEVLGLGWDVVITVCDEAYEACPVLPGATLSVHWGMADPAGAENEVQAFEETYELLERRVDALLELPIEALDPRELKWELERLLLLP